jgi:hypothetical protein
MRVGISASFVAMFSPSLRATAQADAAAKVGCPASIDAVSLEFHALTA